MLGIFITYPLVKFFRLVTHFCSGHNMRRFERGDCNRKLKLALHILHNLVRVTLWSFIFVLKYFYSYACQSCNIVIRIIILYTVIVA